MITISSQEDISHIILLNIYNRFYSNELQKILAQFIKILSSPAFRISVRKSWLM